MCPFLSHPKKALPLDLPLLPFAFPSQQNFFNKELSPIGCLHFVRSDSFCSPPYPLPPPPCPGNGSCWAHLVAKSTGRSAYILPYPQQRSRSCHAAFLTLFLGAGTPKFSWVSSNLSGQPCSLCGLFFHPFLTCWLSLSSQAPPQAGWTWLVLGTIYILVAPRSSPPQTSLLGQFA